MDTSSTQVLLGTATPGGGFPFYGDAAAANVNETDPSLSVQTQNTAGSAENIQLLEGGRLDMALVAGEPAYEAFAGIGRPKSNLKIIAAIYSSPGMFGVRKDSAAMSVRDLIGKPIVWGTRASGITLLGKYVMNGLGLERDTDFQPLYLEKAAGWPNFTAITKAGGRLIGLLPEEIEKVRNKHNFLKPISVPAGSYPGQKQPIRAVGSWSYILARPDLDEDVAYRFARALALGREKLMRQVAQAAETLPENTLAASPKREQIHAGVLRYLAEAGVANTG